MYQQQDFDHLQYNPMDEGILGNQELEGLFPPISIPPPKKKKKKNEDEEDFEIEEDATLPYDQLKPNVLRYVIAMYDPQSPLRKDHPKLFNRQGEAFQVAGIEDDKVKQALFDNSDQFFVGVIHNYLKDYAQSMLYAQIQANESVFWEYVRRMMTFSVSADDDIIKSKMGDDLGKIQERVEALTKKFYGDDERLAVAAQNVKRKRSNPESWARTNV